MFFAFAVSNSTLLSNNQLRVDTYYHNKTGQTDYLPDGWDNEFIGGGVTWGVYYDQTRS